MRIDEFITSLRKQHNIIVVSDNGELKIRAAQQSLSKEIVADIRSRKLEIIEFFKTIEESQQLHRIPAAAGKPCYKLSVAQKRIYFMYELDRSSVAYNMPIAVKLSGQLDKKKLQAVFEQLINRHESLRTYFTVINGEPVQKIAESVNFSLAHFQSAEAGAQAVIASFIRPFDLGKAPLIRTGLIELAANEHILMADMHHIVTDGVSIGILVKEFMALYNNEMLPELKLQYKDYSEWQQGEEQQKKILKQKDFWLREFSEELTALELPCDFVRPSIKTYAGNSYQFDLSMEDTARLKALAEKEGCTLFMVLLSAFNVLMSKLSGQEDIVIGSSTAGRNHADLDGAIGMFVNTIPLRNYPKGSLRFRDFLQDVKTRVLACFANQAYTYAELIDELKIERNTGRNPFFDVMFDLQNFNDAAIEIPGLKLSAYDSGRKVSKFDLTLTADESANRILLNLEYSTELFSKETIERFCRYFRQIIAAIGADAGISIAGIQLLTAAEKQQLLTELNGPSTPVTEETLISLFEKQVEKTPNSTAIFFEGKTLTYAELNRLSDLLAQLLQADHNIQPEDVIGIELDRSNWMIIAILGVLKAGAAYVPIDPQYPSARKEHIIADSGLKLLISETYYFFSIDYYNGPVIAIDVQLNPDAELSIAKQIVSPRSLAYIIYTSGSTGSPKGAMIAHGALTNYITWAAKNYSGSGKADFPLYTSIAFDLTITSIFTPLVTGGRIIVYRENEKELTIEKVITDGEAAVIKLTPSHLKILKDSKLPAEALQTRRRFIVGGEQLESQLAKDIHNKFGGNIEIYNEYGPTETTVGCMIYKFDPADDSPAVSIGLPMDNARIYLLDRNMQLSPPGTSGEMYIGGRGLARGYRNNEELTKERFVQDPFVAGEKIYKTGDLARRLPNGMLEFLGRIDDQVKIRGHRIELGEIENQLSQHGEIKQAAVLVKEKEGGKYLAAYYVSAEPIEADELRAYLLETLPDYMAPACYVWMERLPLTINGKLDRRALPAPVVEQDNYAAPSNEKEKLLAQVWAKVLGLERVGVTDNFFLIGGDSIKSVQISSRLFDDGYNVSVKDIFGSKTIRELAAKLRKTETASGQEMVTGSAALSPIQRWFFEGPVTAKHHFNQSVMLSFANGIPEDTVRRIFAKLQEHHDALRMVFRQQAGEIIQTNLENELPVALEVHHVQQEADAAATILSLSKKMQAGISLEHGPLMKLGLFHLQDKSSRLLVVIHHLVVDGVSWRILAGDIETLYQQAVAHEPLSLPLKTAPYLSWTQHLLDHTKTSAYQQAKKYWDVVLQKQAPSIPRDFPAGTNFINESNRQSFQLSEAQTAKLLTEVHLPFNTQINDILLAALLLSIGKQYGHHAVKIDLEGHGREDIRQGLNISRTIGWFTSIYPVILEKKEVALAGLIKEVKETLRSIPNSGIDYLVQKYLDANGALPENGSAAISFNYLGQFDADTKANSFQVATEAKGDEISPEEARIYDWDISGIVAGAQLGISLTYSKQQYTGETISSLLAFYKESLQELIDYCCNYGKKELTPSDLSYKKLSIAKLNELRQAYEFEDAYPLSPMQEGMLFHSLLDAGSANYFEQVTYTLKSSMDMQLVEKSMNTLVERYDILRTVFVHEGLERPLQLVLKSRKIDFVFKDVHDECNASGSGEVISLYQSADKARTFDLTKDVLMRLTVLQTAPDEFVFIWSHHHAVMDGWCMGIIINEFSHIYAAYNIGNKLSLPPVNAYSNYIKWLEERDKEASAKYWADYLQGYDSLATFPASEGGAQVELSSQQLVLDKAQTSLLHKVTGSHAVTINTLIQCAWGLLLGSYNNVNDVVFGSVVAGRPPEIQGIETMIGLFINTIPVRVQYEPKDTIAALLQKMQGKALDSEQHQYHPLSDIQALTSLGSSLLDHIIVFENYPVAEKINGQGYAQDYAVTDVQIFEQTNYSLALMVIPGEAFRLRIDYNANRYDEGTIRPLLARLRRIIEQLISTSAALVSEIEIVSEEEKQQVLQQFNDTKADYPKHETIISLFDQQVARTPANTAIIYGDEKLTYLQLQEESCKLAAYLQTVGGIKTGQLVGIMLEREEYLVPSIFGILRAGAAYVPIDPNYPVERTNAIIADAGLKAVITRKKHLNAALTASAVILELDEAAASISKYPANEITSNATGNDLAYVIYTSGSTGKPKGAMIEHHSVINRLLWMQKAYMLSEEDVLIQKTPIVFDVSVWELFWWSFTGASLHVLAPGEEKEPSKIIAAVERSKVTTMHFVPSMLSVFLAALDEQEVNKLRSLRQVFVSGEALRPEHVTAFGQSVNRHCGTRLINLYGPTEATVDVSYYECNFHEGNTSLPIGKPIDNIRLYILNAANQLCPAGIPGELCIGGVGVARGYLNNQKLTEEKFIVHPAVGERIYRTGDLVKWLPDGNIAYLGRMDHQVKLRGYRIELGEIESQLLLHESVKEAVVIAKENEGDKYLVTYYVSSAAIDPEILKAFLFEKLPAYMVPAHYVHLEKLPLSTNGKLDRRALPEPGAGTTGTHKLPSGGTAGKLGAIFARVLHLHEVRIGLHDDFFRLGGHSIRAVHLINEIYKEFSVKVPLRKVFENPTVKKLSEIIRGMSRENIQPIPKAGQQDFYPTSSAQERMFYEYLQNKHSLAYNISNVFRIMGDVSISRIEQCFRALTGRHEGLRTSFELSDNGVIQRIHSIPDFKIELLDYSDLNEAYSNFVRPFDLSTAPLMRAALLSHEKEGNLLFIDVHHIVCDGISLNILMNDFKSLYLGSELSPIELTYADYATWQKSAHKSLAKQKAYWLEKLSGELPLLDMPREQSKETADIQPASVRSLHIEGRLYQSIRQLAAGANVSDYMFLLSIYYILLSKMTGSTDIIIGTDVVGRTQPALNNIVGTFINILPLRMQLSHDTPYNEFLAEVRDCVLEAFDNQDLQFDELMSMVNANHYPERGSIVEVHFAFANFFESEVEVEGLQFETLQLQRSQTTQYEFKLEAFDSGSRLSIQFIYSKALYSDETINTLMEYFSNILAAVLKNNSVTLDGIEMQQSPELLLQD